MTGALELASLGIQPPHIYHSDHKDHNDEHGGSDRPEHRDQYTPSTETLIDPRSYSNRWAQRSGRLPPCQYPIIMKLNCYKLKPPSRYLCERYTGLNYGLQRAFFSSDENEARYQEAKSQIKSQYKYGGEISFTVLVPCKLGTQRSVAMAERLAASLGRGVGVRARAIHHDLGELIRQSYR